MIKEEIIGNLIKDVAFAEYLIKSNLSEYDMAKLVCHAPISLCEKQSLYKKLLGEKNYGNVNGESENFDDRFSYENYLRIATKAIDDLNLPKDGTFLLVGHSFDNGYDEQFECAPFRSYRAVQKYLNETFDEGGIENIWYTLEKWLPESGETLGLTEVCEFAFIGKEPCFYKNLRYFYDKKFRERNRRQLLTENDFTLFSSGNGLNLPTPFRAGDILYIDCRPFAPKTIVTVTDNRSEFDCCNPQCEYTGENGEKKCGALKHSHIYKEDVIESVSPLYNLKWEKK